MSYAAGKYGSSRLPPPPLRPLSTSSKPAVTYRYCVVCEAVDEERFMKYAECCQEWMHKHKHPLLYGGCFWKLCSRVTDWQARKEVLAAAATATADHAGKGSAAQATAQKTASAAAGASVKPAAVDEADRKIAAAYPSPPGGLSAAGAAAISSGAKPAAKQTEADAKDEYAKKLKMSKQVKEQVIGILTNKLNQVCEKGTDLFSIIEHYGLGAYVFHPEIKTVSFVFQPDENGLLNLLNARSWKDGEKENLQKAFDQFKVEEISQFEKEEASKLDEQGISQLIKGRLFAYNQIKAFLYPDSTPLEFAYVYARYGSVDKSSSGSAGGSVSAAAVMPPPDKAARELEVAKAVAALPADLTFEGAMKMIDELYKSFEAGKVDFEQLKLQSLVLVKFLAEKNKSKQPQVDLGEAITNIMLAQTPQFFAKIESGLKNSVDDGRLFAVRAYHSRIYAFKIALEDYLDAFIKAPTGATFSKLIDWSKRYNFDSIAFLKDKFVWKEDAQTEALAKFFGFATVIPANQAWVAAFKPIVDAAKKELEAEVQRAAAHRYAFNFG
jgi:hypothetical protein